MILTSTCSEWWRKVVDGPLSWRVVLEYLDLTFDEREAIRERLEAEPNQRVAEAIAIAECDVFPLDAWFEIEDAA